MSRGHGRRQRRLLAILNTEERAFGTFELAAMIHDIPAGENGTFQVTGAQASATRRALVKLAKERRVFDLGYAGRRKTWAGEQFGLRIVIRRWQSENRVLSDASALNGDTLKRRTGEMQPLLERARELGIYLPPS